MNSFFYFILAVLLIVGLLLIGGYIGKGNMQRSYSTAGSMSKLVSGNDHSDDLSKGRGCHSCKWY